MDGLEGSEDGLPCHWIQIVGWDMDWIGLDLIQMVVGVGLDMDTSDHVHQVHC